MGGNSVVFYIICVNCIIMSNSVVKDIEEWRTQFVQMWQA